MLPHQGSKRLKRNKVDKRHRSVTPMLEDKPKLQLAKPKSICQYRVEHKSDGPVGGNASKASKGQDTPRQVESSSLSSGTLPLLEGTQVGYNSS